MRTKEETVETALEAFWAKVQELHPERETDTQPPTETYDLEMWARHAVDTWLAINRPVFYVQRTLVQVVKITGAETPEEAEANAADIDDPTWFERSLDTSKEYIVLDRNGKQWC